MSNRGRVWLLPQPPPDENSTRSLLGYIVFEDLGKEVFHCQDIMQIS